MDCMVKNKVKIIAEVGNSHEGNMITAKRIIKSVSETGADAIKFQRFFADELVEKNHEKYNLFKNLEMSSAEWKELISYAKSTKLEIFVDVFGIKSAKEISKFSIDGYKIHSSDLNNPHLLDFFACSKKPILVSIAGSKLNELEHALKILQKEKKEITLMYGFQGYPTKISDLNLENIIEIKKRFTHTIGISDHVSGSSEITSIVPLLGISLGARVVEKHITLDRAKKGIDYQSSIEPKEFKNLVSLIRSTERSLPKTGFELKSNEIKYRLDHKKNAIAKKIISPGTILTKNLFEYKRTKVKNESIPFFEYEGQKIIKTLQKGSSLTKSYLKSHKIAAVIACRVDSGRLFGKPLQPIGKYCILELLLKQLKKSNLIDDIILAISQNDGNEVFVNFAKKNNLKFIQGDDRDVLERLIKGAKFVNADTILRITSENPYIYWEGIDSLIKKHLDNNSDLTTFSDLPLGTSMEIIKSKALEKSHKLGTKKHRSELCTLFINENPEKFKILRIKPEKELCKPEIRLTVDTPEDLLVAKIIYESLNIKNKLIKIKKIIKFLEKNSSILNINSNIPLRYKKF
jgi:N,N'-diacetyllegionaminate synthase